MSPVFLALTGHVAEEEVDSNGGRKARKQEELEEANR